MFLKSLSQLTSVSLFSHWPVHAVGPMAARYPRDPIGAGLWDDQRDVEQEQKHCSTAAQPPEGLNTHTHLFLLLRRTTENMGTCNENHFSVVLKLDLGIWSAYKLTRCEINDLKLLFGVKTWYLTITYFCGRAITFGYLKCLQDIIHLILK